MNCCRTTRNISPETAKGIGSFFSKNIGKFRKQAKTQKFEKSQRVLLETLKKKDLSKLTILDIGCGTGVFHQKLLQAGAETATGIDLSEGMLAEAKRLAEEKGLNSRTEYHLGDFATDGDKIESKSLVILDKVVCCYPDAAALLEKAIPKAKNTIALIYPRDNGVSRVVVGFIALLMKLFRVPFRPYVHSSKKIEEQINTSSFQKTTDWKGIIWRLQVFERA